MKFVIYWLMLAMCLFLTPLTNAAISVPDPLDRIVAVVNDDVITAIELENETADIKKQLRQQNTRFPSDSILKKQILDRMVLQRLQLQQAERVHIKVNDEMLNRTLNNIASQNNLSLDGLREALEKDGTDFNRFRENMRNEIIINQLQKRQVLNQISITAQEIDIFLQNQSLQAGANDEYNLGHILIALPEGANADQIQKAKLKAEKAIDDLNNGADFTQMAIAISDGQQALEGGDLGWRNFNSIPTLFSDWLKNQEVNQISPAIRSPSGFHIIKLLGKRKNEQQHIVEQTQVRHILVRTGEFTSSSEARDRILKYRDRITKGENFADLAKLHSEDPGSSVKGGDLGWVNPGDMVPAFEKAFLSLKIGQVSEPVQTRFGWHIIEVMERRRHDNTEVVMKQKARESIRIRKTEPALQNWFRRLRDDSFVEVRL